MDGLATKGLCTHQASLTLREQLWAQTRAERVPTCQMEKMPWLHWLTAAWLGEGCPSGQWPGKGWSLLAQGDCQEKVRGLH